MHGPDGACQLFCTKLHASIWMHDLVVLRTVVCLLQGTEELALQGPHPPRLPAQQLPGSFTIKDLHHLESQSAEPGYRIKVPGLPDPDCNLGSPDRSTSQQRPGVEAENQVGPISSSGTANGLLEEACIDGGLQDGRIDDIRSIGILALQLFQRKLLFVPWTDG